ncbi:MAG: InlB B-repeat-containing protein [Bacilli bacterium]|nr:InlB B-repeat-containing protein [Bacilli bacterium]
MKKKYLLISTAVLILFIFLVLGGTVDKIQNAVKVSFSNSTSNTKTYTREQLQNYVVGTALSYENNKAYSDYEQRTMDVGSSTLGSRFNWRTFNVNPEMVSRGNYFAIDCSSFATSVYLYSLGFDFRDYYTLSGSVYTKNFSNKSAKTSVSNFVEAYSKNGKGINTEFLAKIGKNKNGKNDIVAYYYEPTSSVNETTIKSKIKSTLKPGDLLIYRRKSGSGHVMVYVGDIIDSKLGFVHATGKDYDFDSNPINYGDDDFSIRYDSYEGRMNKIKISNMESITILRPINKFCDGNTCTIDKSTSKDTLQINKLNINAVARYDVARLRVEQYVRATKVTTDTSIGKNTTSDKSLSKYNAISKGDTLEYRLYLHNRSIREFCDGDAVNTTSSACSSAGYTWKKTASSKSRSYDGMKITSKIPDNTTYVSGSCDPTCNYNSSTRTISWNVASLAADKSKTYKYKVTVGDTSKVVNEGMKLTTPNGYTLQLARIETKVNPTFTKRDIETMHTNINKFKSLVSSKKIKYDGSSSSGDNISLDKITNESISQLGFIRSMYFNTFGIDLSFVTNANVKSAIFDKNSAKDYARKTSSEVSSLTNDNYKKINNMLVNGFYGGTYLRGNDAGDRAGMLRVSDLEVGDIIMTYYTSDSTVAKSVSSYLYLGTDADSLHYFARFTKDDGIVIYSKASSSLKSGYKIFKEFYSKDLFVVLRPLQVYGTTIKYNYNGGSGNYSSYTAYSKYRNLYTTPTKSNQTLSLVYNKTVDSSYKSSYSFSYTFGGWYSDAGLTKKVSNSTTLASSSYHSLYAKWNTTSIKLPNPTVSGYKLEGWYSDAGLTKKVAAGNSDYMLMKSTTLYGKWKANSYQVKYNANGGTGTMANSTFTYGKTSNLRANTFTKNGYVFNGWSTSSSGSVKYKDKASVSNLTTGTNVVNLYAVWKEAEKVVVEVSVNKGTSNSSSKTIVKGSTASFTLTPNTGYSNGTVSCTNNQKASFDGITLKVINVTLKTLCTVTYSPNKYNVKYNPNGGVGTMANSIHTYSISQKLSANAFKKTGYVFKGWSLSTTGSVKYKDGASVSNLTTGTNTINLYAQWSPNSYQVKYNANGGVGTMDNSIYTYDTASHLKSNTYKKDGYIFAGWSTSGNGVVVYLDNQNIKNLTTGTNVVNLYAVWQKKTNNDITVTLNVEKGSSSPKTRVVVKGQNTTFILNPNIGYGNGKVTCTNNQKGVLNGNTLIINNVTSNTTCTVKYSVNTYNIKYNSNGGIGTMDNSIHTYNQVASLSKNKFSKNGYNFKGWSLSSNGKLEFIDESKVKNLTTSTNDVNLYAVWEKIAYNISYDLDGGLIENELKEYDIETNNITLAIPNKKGYEFVGWTGSNGTTPEKTVVINKGTYGDLSYKANWKDGEYTILYNSDSFGKITGITSEKVKFKGNPSGTTKSINDGYFDLKWAVNKDVTLNNGKTIKKGEAITLEQIKEISVDDDLIITAYHYKTKIFVSYGNDDNGKVIGIVNEDVAVNGNLLGTEVQANKGYVFSHWIADKDVKLSTGKIIIANNVISNEELTKIIVVEDLDLKAVFVGVDYDIVYQSDINGQIVGLNKETKKYQQNPSGTSVVSKTGYVFAYWMANQDVILNDGSIIKKNSMITNEELMKVSIDNNVIFTAKNSNDILKVFYKAKDNIKIEGNDSEEVSYDSNPKGIKIVTDNNKKVVWTADHDIVLKDDTKIYAGQKITDEQLKNIIVKDDLILTVQYAIEVENKNDNNINLNIFIIIGIVLLLVFGLIIFLIKKKKSLEE